VGEGVKDVLERSDSFMKAGVPFQRSASIKTLSFLATWLFITISANADTPKDFSFDNYSTNELWVTDVLFDGKQFDVPPGVLVPGGSQKTISDGFPNKIPGKFTILFRMSSQSLTQYVSGKEVSQLLKQARHAPDVTVHFIYSHRGEFIPKVEARSGAGLRADEAKLWPDENEPGFQKYKALVRAAYAGKAEEVRRELDAGAPFSWPDNPLGISPLEYTAARNHERAFDELMKVLPFDYSPYMYGNCIKLASQEGHTNILINLLAKPQADTVPPRLLPEIFYSACYSAKIPAALEILLRHYPVGIDFQVRDYGHTLLFVAVQGRNYTTVEWLVSHGANKNVTLKNGSKPIDSARDDRMRQLLTP
jgi:hypothetical protein